MFTLCYALFRGDHVTVPYGITEEQLGRLPVAVDCKPGTSSPLVSHCPHHGIPVELIKAIGGVQGSLQTGSPGTDPSTSTVTWGSGGTLGMGPPVVVIEFWTLPPLFLFFKTFNQ